jgi:hypothetical protein
MFGAAEDLSRDRVELKYLVLPKEVEGLLGELGTLPPGGSFRAQECRITTVYLDRPDGALARRALEGWGPSVKVRLREYFPIEGTEGSAFVWIEVKEREGRTSRKTRFPLHKALVAPFFRGQADAARILDGSDPVGPRERVIEGVRRVREIARGGPLLPAGATSYRRWAVEGGHPRARLTVDREITYHLGEIDLYEERRELDREALGPVAVEHPGGVAELKYRGLEIPLWWERALRKLSPVDFSKFLTLSALAVSEAQAACAYVEAVVSSEPQTGGKPSK